MFHQRARTVPLRQRTTLRYFTFSTCLPLQSPQRASARYASSALHTHQASPTSQTPSPKNRAHESPDQRSIKSSSITLSSRKSIVYTPSQKSINIQHLGPHKHTFEVFFHAQTISSLLPSIIPDLALLVDAHPVQPRGLDAAFAPGGQLLVTAILSS